MTSPSHSTASSDLDGLGRKIMAHAGAPTPAAAPAAADDSLSRSSSLRRARSRGRILPNQIEEGDGSNPSSSTATPNPSLPSTPRLVVRTEALRTEVPQRRRGRVGRAAAAAARRLSLPGQRKARLERSMSEPGPRPVTGVPALDGIELLERQKADAKLVKLAGEAEAPMPAGLALALQEQIVRCRQLEQEVERMKRCLVEQTRVAHHAKPMPVWTKLLRGESKESEPKEEVDPWAALDKMSLHELDELAARVAKQRESRALEAARRLQSSWRARARLVAQQRLRRAAELLDREPRIPVVQSLWKGLAHRLSDSAFSQLAQGLRRFQHDRLVRELRRHGMRALPLPQSPHTPPRTDLLGPAHSAPRSALGGYTSRPPNSPYTTPPDTPPPARSTSSLSHSTSLDELPTLDELSSLMPPAASEQSAYSFAETDELLAHEQLLQQQLQQQQQQQQQPVERELLVWVCNPSHGAAKQLALPHLEREASDISTIMPAAIFNGGGPSLLREELSAKSTRRFLFCGHADAGLGAQKTLGFTSEHTGQLSTVQPETLAEMLGAHSPQNGGRLELVFLNGCCSEELGRAVHAAGVPVVVCWSTMAENSAARIFASTFFRTYMRGKSYRQAFDEAKRAVRTTTRRGRRLEGSGASQVAVESEVPKYAFVDPEDAERVANGRVTDAGFSPEPFAAGLPLLLHADGYEHVLRARTLPSRTSSLSASLERLRPRRHSSECSVHSAPGAWGGAWGGGGAVGAGAPVMRKSSSLETMTHHTPRSRGGGAPSVTFSSTSVSPPQPRLMRTSASCEAIPATRPRPASRTGGHFSSPPRRRLLPGSGASSPPASPSSAIHLPVHLSPQPRLSGGDGMSVDERLSAEERLSLKGY